MKNNAKDDRSTGMRRRIVIPLATATVLVAGAALLTGGKEADRSEADRLRLQKEELIGEKLNLEKRLADLERERALAAARAAEAEQRQAALEERLAAAARPAGTNAAGSSRMKRELAEAAATQDRLRRDLEAALSGQRALQDQLDALRAERDGLATRLSQQQAGARMVNNALVDAVRGKRQQLTVRARRAREIRMAFDLPEAIASGASFRIVSPSGRTFEGSGPALSVVPADPTAGALAARFSLLEGAGQERATRVHLKFRPEKRLEPGTYRIDISSGELYLNTVMLNLR